MSKKRSVLCKKSIFYNILLLILFHPSSGEAERAKEKNIKIPPSINYVTENYLTSGSRSTEIGIAIAKKNMKSEEPLPVVVFIHGGGWRSGDKDQSIWQCFRYASDGFVGITISYRLIDEAPLPQCIEDVKTAIRYIKSLATDYPIDTDNIGVWGYSAGAHLALMAGLDTNTDSFNSGLYKEFNGAVKCIAAIAAPTDFSNKRNGSQILSKDQGSDVAFKSKISPLTYINPNQVPVLMIHGTNDRIVPPYHYERFADAGEQSGLDNFELIEALNCDHLFYFKHKEYGNKVRRFFVKMLKNTQK